MGSHSCHREMLFVVPDSSFPSSSEIILPVVEGEGKEGMWLGYAMSQRDRSCRAAGRRVPINLLLTALTAAVFGEVGPEWLSQSQRSSLLPGWAI